VPGAISNPYFWSCGGAFADQVTDTGTLPSAWQSRHCGDAPSEATSGTEAWNDWPEGEVMFACVWQVVQSACELPAVWQLAQPIKPGASTAVAPTACVRPLSTGKYRAWSAGPNVAVPREWHA